MQIKNFTLIKLLILLSLCLLGNANADQAALDKCKEDCINPNCPMDKGGHRDGPCVTKHYQACHTKCFEQFFPNR